MYVTHTSFSLEIYKQQQHTPQLKYKMNDAVDRPTSSSVSRRSSLTRNQEHDDDQLSRQIGRLVRQTIAAERKTECSFPGIGRLMTVKHPSAVLFWLVMILACLAMCVTQVWNRVDYYMQEVVAIDVTAEGKTPLPNFVICSSHHKVMSETYKRFNLGTTIGVICFLPVDELLSRLHVNMTLTEIWETANTSYSFVNMEADAGVSVKAVRNLYSCDKNEQQLY